MNRRIFTLPLSLLVVQFAAAQACPKVTYLNTTATIQSLVTSVNCLIDTVERSRATKTQTNKPAVSVDVFQVLGRQHTRAYGKVVFAVLALLDADAKSALVLPDKGEAIVPAASGIECNAKINSDNTVDAQCNFSGAALYVVYRN
jgi:hypothetical protein